MVTHMKYLFGAVAALAVLILAHIDPAFAQAAAEARTPAYLVRVGVQDKMQRGITRVKAIATTRLSIAKTFIQGA